MYAKWIRQCYRVIVNPRITPNSSIHSHPECPDAISKRNIHLSRWNIFNDDSKQRKTRGEPKDLEHEADATSNRLGANEYEERMRRVQRVPSSKYFEKLRRGSYMKLPTTSSTLRVTIPNKAREYNENVRQKISAKIFKIVGRFSLNSSRHAEQTAEVIIKPAVPIQSAGKEIYIKQCGDETKDKRATVRDKTPSDAKVSEYVNRHMATPMVKCGCLGTTSNLKLPRSSAASTDTKDDELSLNSLGVNKREDEDREPEAEPAQVSRMKKSSGNKIKRKSLVQKYTIKSPSALNTDEFADLNESIPQRSPSKGKQGKIRSPNLKAPLSIRYNKGMSKDKLSKSHKIPESMSPRRKPARKKVKKNKESKKTDEMFTKLGLADDKNLRNKIDGDLYMNVWDILEKEENRKVSGMKGETEWDKMERDLIKARKNRSSISDKERSVSPRGKASSKKMKHNKSDIEQILDSDMVRRYRKLKLDSTKTKSTSKSKHRRIKVKKGKGVKRKRTRKTVITAKKTKPKRSAEECGDVSQNE